MRIFILGGTGSIGTAIVRELRRRSHDVVALSRSDISDDTIRRLGAMPHRGNLREPAAWIGEAFKSDAIIHVAATFTEDMGQVDSGLVSAVIRESKAPHRRLRLLYTGGCWLYGETGDEVATEGMPFNPVPAFGWMVENAKRLLETPTLSVAVVHPGMVYHRHGGVFTRFVEAAREGRAIEIWGSPDTRWPLIHSSDAAHAYCDLLERPELTGHFNATSEQGVRVGDIANTVGKAFGSDLVRVVVDVDDLIMQHGGWARGPTLDQQMSAAKLRSSTDWRPHITDYRKSDVFES